LLIDAKCGALLAQGKSAPCGAGSFGKLRTGSSPPLRSAQDGIVVFSLG